MLYTLYLQFKTDLDDDGHTLLDFARRVPQIVTPEDMNIQPRIDEDVAEIRRRICSEMTVNTVQSQNNRYLRHERARSKGTQI